VPQLPSTQHRTIVVVDVAGFTDPSRTMTHLRAVQEGVYEVLHLAFFEAGIDLVECQVEDRGDGALILIPPTISKSLLADQLPSRLVAGLLRYNAIHSIEAKVKLRVSLHSGEIHLNRHGAVSPAVNHACRILDAAEAKVALANSQGVLALIVSTHFFDEVIAQDAGTAPETYRRIPVNVKQTTAEAWLRLPDVPASAAPASVETPTMTGEDQPWELIAEPNLVRLREILAGLAVPHLPTLISRAAGSAVPIPPRGDAWAVFNYLSDFNAGPDGLPPNLAFVDLLAKEVGGAIGASLRAWADQQAAGFRRGTAIQQRRNSWTDIQKEPHLYLVFAVEPDAIDETRCRVTYWRQDDPREWPPALGGSVDTTVADLEFDVDRLIMETERAWSGESVSAGLEFILPRTLLHLPVHLWQKERDSGDPRPLCLDYEITIRSLERMRAPHWHRLWRKRWGSMLKDPSAARVYSSLTSKSNNHRIDAVLSDLEWVGLVMTEAPAPHPKVGAGPDELTTALRSGLPVLCWHPTASEHDLRQILDQLFVGDGLMELPSRTRHSRKSIYSSSTLAETNPISEFFLMWDDPNRLLALGQSTMLSPS
jgi:hypothetical protein